jgi:glycosyltransferase involved in cell wall biosynthesis
MAVGTGVHPAHDEAAVPAPAAPARVGEDGAASRARPAGAPLPVVVLTTFFPNPRDPHRTPFLRHLVRALDAHCAVRVVAPVPRRPQVGPWRDPVAVPEAERHDGVELLHPRYLAVPGLHWLSGWTYYLGVRRTLRALRQSHGPFVLHAHCAYPDAVGAAWVARDIGVPLVVTVHGSDINVSARQRLLRPQIRWALRGAKRVLAVSRALQEQVRALTGLAPERLACIPCAGYAPEVFRPRPKGPVRAELGVRADARLVLFVGHLFPVKAVDVLLRAWGLRARRGSLAPDEQLVVVGEGGERARLERLAREEGVAAHVRFLGPLPQERVADWLAVADLLCLPSHSEGSPNVVVEALASGVPVVATRVGGVPDLVSDGVNGMLVPPADPAALADALDAARGRAWDAAAIAETVAHLTWRALGARNHDALARAAAPGRVDDHPASIAKD